MATPLAISPVAMACCSIEVATEFANFSMAFMRSAMFWIEPTT